MAKGQLTVRVIGDTKPFNKSVGGIGKTLGKIAKVGAAAFGAVGGAAIGGAFKVAAVGDEIAKSARKAGLAAEPFQELRFAFGQGGVEAATMDTALLKFNKRLGESATGTGTASEAFETLGVKLTDASGGVRDTTATLDEVLPKLAAIESDAERAALAGDLFGQRAGPELAAALGQGIDGIDAARQKAQDLGIVMSEDATLAAEKFTDSWDDLKQGALGMLRDGLTPVMEMLTDKVFPFIKDRVIPTLQDFREWLGPKLQEAGSTVSAFMTDTVVPAFQRLAEWWEEHGPVIIEAAMSLWEGIKTAIGGIVSAVQFVIEHWDKFKIAVGIAVGIMIPLMVKLAVAATVNAIKVKVAWIVTQAAAIKSAVVHSAQVGVMVVKWAFLATKSMFHAAKVAAAWLIAMGPIAIVIAAVIGLVAVIVTNWEKIKEVIAAGWESVKKKTREFVNSLMSIVTGIKDRVTNFFSNAGSWLVNAGKNIIGGLIGGITSKIGDIGGAIGGAASKIRNFLPFSPAKEGPLSGSGSPEIAGAKIAEMLSDGMKGARQTVSASASDLASAASVQARGQLAGMVHNGGTVMPSDKGGRGGGVVINVNAPNLVVGDRRALEDLFLDVLVKVNRRVGPLPVTVRD